MSPEQPPGANGTTMRMGLLGKGSVSACAGEAANRVDVRMMRREGDMRNMDMTIAV